MKNICKFIFAAAAVLAAASCTKEYVTEEYYNYTGVQNEIITLAVGEFEWSYDYDGDGNVYYLATFPVKQLTDRAFKEGIILVYRDMGDVQAILPSTRHFQNYLVDQFGHYIYDPEGKLQVASRWTETIDYELSVGSLTVYYTINDFIYPTDERGNELTPGDMKFRLIITY